MAISTSIIFIAPVFDKRDIREGLGRGSGPGIMMPLLLQTHQLCIRRI